MTDQRDIPMKAEAVRALMEERLGVRGRTLGASLRQARRMMPRWARKQTAIIVRADRAARSPKTAKQIDRTAFMHAYELVTNHLRAINVNAQRRDRLLRLLGTIALQVLILVAAFVGILWWRGHV